MEMKHSMRLASWTTKFCTQ